MTTTPTKDAFDQLHEAVEAIDPAALRELAVTIDTARSDAEWEKLLEHHQINDERIATTAFEYQAGVLAYQAGVLAWDCNERYYIRPAPEDIHPNLSPADYWARLKLGRLDSPPMWPFRDDAVLADYTGYGLPRWWSHGLVHSLVGFAWWPELTEMELLYTARFSECLAAWHWYWLCDLGRDYCPLHRGHIARRDYGMCPDCNALEHGTPNRGVRAQRIESEFGEWLSSSGLVFLANEVGALRSGFRHGELVVPPFGTSLGLGEAADYAIWHHRRLRGRGFRRFLERCMEPGRDYAGSPEQFASGCQALLERLTQWRPPGGPVWARRGRRALQDVGYRLCMAAARAGDHDRHDKALDRLGESIARLAEEPDEETTEAILGEALSECAESWISEAPEAERKETRIFALGYRPTRREESEPEVCRQDRLNAVCQVIRSRQMPPLFESFASLLIDAPRRPSDLTRDLMERAAQGFAALPAAVFAWWRSVDLLLSMDARVVWETGWQFRYSLRRLPHPTEWSLYRLTRNPLVIPVPAVFERQWVVALLAGEAQMPPPLVKTIDPLPSLLVGVTPTGPLVLAMSDEMGLIWERAEQGASLAELIELTSEETVSRALESGAFACAWERGDLPPSEGCCL